MTTESNVMSAIGRELERAEEREYLSLLVQNSSIITAVFYPHIKQLTVELVVRHINLKYGKYVIAWCDSTNPHKIEIWYKEIALT